MNYCNLPRYIAIRFQVQPLGQDYFCWLPIPTKIAEGAGTAVLGWKWQLMSGELRITFSHFWALMFDFRIYISDIIQYICIYIIHRLQVLFSSTSEFASGSFWDLRLTKSPNIESAFWHQIQHRLGLRFLRHEPPVTHQSLRWSWSTGTWTTPTWPSLRHQ